MNPLKVLFIATSHNKMGDTTAKTGAWLEEISIPYYAFKEAGAEMTIASPKGGLVPLDPKSQSVILSTFSTKRFMKDEEAIKFLSNSFLLENMNAADFDVVYITGGHGPMWDLADNEKLNQLLEAFNQSKKPIGAICHGVVSLLALKDSNGELLIKGKKLTGFSNTEEGSAGLTATVPFLLETKLISLGALYSKAENYMGHVVEDRNIITGQNSASSNGVVQKIFAVLKYNKFRTTLLQPSLN